VNFLPTLVLLLMLLAAWELVVQLGKVADYLMPRRA
jgi:ABC-type nitrate/sulfonate/bicarbonate transport system permease component